MKDEITELRELCADIRKFIQEERLSEAKEKIALGMAQHPDAGIPHNLMGIVKKKKKRQGRCNETFSCSLCVRSQEYKYS